MTTARTTAPEAPDAGGATLAGAGERRVHFSQGGLKGGGGNVAVSAALIPLFLLYGAIGAFAVFVALGRFAWMPAAVRATVVTLAFAVVLAALFRLAARGYSRVMAALKLPMEMDPSADLNVVCWPDQRDRLAGEIPETGTAGAFEPEVFRVWIARRVSLTRRLLDRRFRRRFVAAVIALPILLQVIAHASTLGWAAWEPIVAAAGLAMAAPFAWAFVRPTYLRVAPGRVDVVRFTLGRGVAEVETHDLRSRPVRLDLRRKELLIGGWHSSHESGEASSGEETEEEKRLMSGMWMAGRNSKDPQASLGSARQIRELEIVPLWGAFEIRALERAVFRAGVSTAEPGPLPDDALL